jgi:nucleotide-binding universal stress UspA family protein
VFARIVVATDFSACAEAGWVLARRLAAALGSELILFHVLIEGTLWSETPFNMERVRELFAEGRSRTGQKLDEWAAQARAEGLAARVVMRDGNPYQEIVSLAADERADLIVVGTHGRTGLGRALLGSVADRVVRLARCPVLTVRAPE